MLYFNKDFRILEKGVFLSSCKIKYIRLGNEDGYYYDIQIPRFLFVMDNKIVHKGFYEELSLEKIGKNNYRIVEKRDNNKYFAILSSFNSIYDESNIFSYNALELKKAYALSPFGDKIWYGIYEMNKTSFIKVNYKYDNKTTIIIKDDKIIECNYTDNRLNKIYHKVDFSNLNLEYISKQDLSVLKIFLKNYKQLAHCLIVENGKKIKDIHELYKSAFNKVDTYKFRYDRNRMYNKETNKSYRLFNDDDNVVIYFCVPTDDIYYDLSILMKIYFNIFIDRDYGYFELYQKDIDLMNGVVKYLEEMA